MNSILVSIVIPVYNGENYLSQAIDSCLKQTYDNIEIIVINDGSSDNTDKIAKSYGSKIRYYKKNNGGVSSALNMGIIKSRGEYISWLSHDDIYLPNKISDQINVLNLSGKYNSIVVCDYSIINDKSKILQNIEINKIMKVNNNLGYLITYGWKCNGCTLLIPKDMFNKYGLFNEKLKYTQDYDMWFKMRNENFICTNNISFYSRVHKNQGTILFSNSNEADELWFNAISNLFNNNEADKFLGFNESIYFFISLFSSLPNMQKTNELISTFNINFSKKEIIKNIQRTFYFYKSNNYVRLAANYYKFYGFKMLIKKIILSIFGQ